MILVSCNPRQKSWSHFRLWLCKSFAGEGASWTELRVQESPQTLLKKLSYKVVLWSCAALLSIYTCGF